MALNALSWQVGFALGPALGGAGLALSPTGVWIAASALCALGAVLALAIEGSLPSGSKTHAAARGSLCLSKQAPRLQSRTWR